MDSRKKATWPQLGDLIRILSSAAEDREYVQALLESGFLSDLSKLSMMDFRKIDRRDFWNFLGFSQRYSIRTTEVHSWREVYKKLCRYEDIILHHSEKQGTILPGDFDIEILSPDTDVCQEGDVGSVIARLNRLKYRMTTFKEFGAIHIVDLLDTKVLGNIIGGQISEREGSGVCVSWVSRNSEQKRGMSFCSIDNSCLADWKIAVVRI
ncbi:MAG: hypothetical protein Q7S84_00735 [bacterium]|nr:hypothetical protein [bacterium]